jgi:hypothetical protein
MDRRVAALLAIAHSGSPPLEQRLRRQPQHSQTTLFISSFNN